MAHIPYDRVQWKDIDWDAVLDGTTTARAARAVLLLGRFAGCYYLRTGLIRKDVLPKYAGADLPPTLVVSDAAELEAGVRSAGPSALWVLKKAAGSNAHGIMFLKGDATPDTVLAAATAAFTPPEDATAGAGGKKKPSPRVWVLQSYVIPATVKGRKFHIRMPVLAVGALAVYAHANCRVISASEPWSDEDLSQTFVHVSNLNVNCKHAGYSAWDQNFCMWAWPAGVAAAVWAQACAITARLFGAVFPNRRHFFALPNCYEMFGLDFLVSRDGVVFLAEVNSDLGMSMFHVYPRSGVVTPGDMPFESAVPPTLPDGGIGMGAALPPVGHLTIPTPGEDVFTASVESLAEKGFVKLCAFEPPVKVTAATDDTDTA